MKIYENIWNLGNPREIYGNIWKYMKFGEPPKKKIKFLKCLNS